MAILFVLSCTYGGSKVSLSESEFIIDEGGGQVLVTTDGCVRCGIETFINEDRQDYYQFIVVSGCDMETEWFTFHAEPYGKSLMFTVALNDTGMQRHIRIFVDDADRHGYIYIYQNKGKN